MLTEQTVAGSNELILNCSCSRTMSQHAEMARNQGCELFEFAVLFKKQS